MPEWIIDCPTFLLLTGAELGQYGDYWIDENGVRGCVDTSSESLRLLESQEQAALLAFNRDAVLALPSSASQVIAWAEGQAGEFPLPDWFLVAAACRSPPKAAAVLTKAAADLTALLETDFSGQEGSQHDCASVLGELDSVRHLLAQTSATGGGERRDPMAREIELAIDLAGPHATVEDVMAELQRLAGSDGSCIFEAISGGVLWRDSSGNSRKLTQKLLSDRLGRAKRAKSALRAR